jgi:WD40 repeat protein
MQELGHKVGTTMSADGRWRATLTQGEGFTVTVNVSRAATGERAFAIPNKSRDAQLAFSHDGSLLAVAPHDVEIYEVPSGKLLRKMKGQHDFPVFTLAFQPSGKLLATAGEDATIKLWNVATGDEVRTLQGHVWGVRSIAFSPDGKFLASGSGDMTVRLWEVATGETVATLRGHNDGVRNVAYHPSGARLASADDDNKIILWDVATGQEALTLDGHSGTLAFSSSGHWLAAVAPGGMRVWDARPLDDSGTR